MMECQQCQGKGFIEVEHGLVQRKCILCNGTGEVEETHFPLHEVLDNQEKVNPEEMPAEVQEILDKGAGVYIPPRAEEIKKTTGGLDDNSKTGDGGVSPTAGSADTSEPEQPKKPKAKIKSSKRCS